MKSKVLYFRFHGSQKRDGKVVKNYMFSRGGALVLIKEDGEKQEIRIAFCSMEETFKASRGIDEVKKTDADPCLIKITQFKDGNVIRIMSVDDSGNTQVVTKGLASYLQERYGGIAHFYGYTKEIKQHNLKLKFHREFEKEHTEEEEQHE